MADARAQVSAQATGRATRTIAAVLADVDGTLVNKAKELTPRAIEAVGKPHQRGVLFAITSGRPPRGMRMLIDPLELRGPRLCARVASAAGRLGAGTGAAGAGAGSAREPVRYR